VARIFDNVILGEGAVVDETAIIGIPPAGAADGELPTVIGAGAIIRSHAVVYAGATVGARFSAGHGALVREQNTLGDDCSVGTHATLEVGNVIGHRVRIHSGCFLANCVIEDDVFIGPNTVFTDDPHPMCPRYRDCVGGGRVRVKASIGANSTILPGVEIGTESLVGAGSVVTADVPARAVVAGNPARVMKSVDQLQCWPGFFDRPYAWREQS
jgi:acetyltransferase-like isoleucine patch superfamily enzyme